MPLKKPEKRLIVCCDGTWQTGDKTYGTSPSNIAKLSRMISRKSKGKIPQVVYYQSGIGTSGFLPGISGGSFGCGLSDNVASAYHYLSTNFNGETGDVPQDEIFLFGFSRGAYTARALGGLITDMGLLKPQFLNDFPKAFGIFKKLGRKAAAASSSHKEYSAAMEDYANEMSAEDREFWAEIRSEQGKTHNNVRIKAIGVWDTVGALGIPDSYISTMLPWINQLNQFHSTLLNEKTENAFQALALDERRGAFPPTLWHLSDDLISKPGCPNLKQCWFAGFHESIGGGGVALQYWFQQWFPTLSGILMPDTSEMHDVTLAWMCDQLEGLLTFDEAAAEYILLQQGKTKSSWAVCMEPDMVQYLKIFKLLCFGGCYARRPGRYYLPEFKTNETIHPSVKYRTENHRLNYKSAPLHERSVSFHQFGIPIFRFNVQHGFLSAIRQDLEDKASRVEQWLRLQKEPIWCWVLSSLETVAALVKQFDDLWESSRQMWCTLGLPTFVWEEQQWQWIPQEATKPLEKRDRADPVKPPETLRWEPPAAPLQPSEAKSPWALLLLLPVALSTFLFKSAWQLFEVLNVALPIPLMLLFSLCALSTMFCGLVVCLIALPVFIPAAVLTTPGLLLILPLIVASVLTIVLVATTVHFSVLFVVSKASKYFSDEDPSTTKKEPVNAKWVREAVKQTLFQRRQSQVELPEWVIRISKDRSNFEANILQIEKWDRLVQGEKDKSEFWTRTTWQNPQAEETTNGLAKSNGNGGTENGVDHGSQKTANGI